MEHNTEPNKKTAISIESSVKTGVSFGCVLAMVISYVTWESVTRAILHGILGWIYVIYFIIKY